MSDYTKWLEKELKKARDKYNEMNKNWNDLGGFRYKSRVEHYGNLIKTLEYALIAQEKENNKQEVFKDTVSKLIDRIKGLDSKETILTTLKNYHARGKL